MKDNKRTTKHFVKIIERFPVLYTSYKNMPQRPKDRIAAWEKVADLVRSEINQECTVEELRAKWKGIRSSFTRYQKKLRLEKNLVNCSIRYYLFDTLAFLLPYSRSNRAPGAFEENSEDDDEWESPLKFRSLYENAPRTYRKKQINNVRNKKDSSANESNASCLGENTEQCTSTIKTEPSYDEDEIPSNSNDTIDITGEEGLKLLKVESLSDDANEATSSNIQMTEENLDLQFFRSILPDIAHFTTQEKRQFKMGVLKVIDDIEESRE